MLNKVSKLKFIISLISIFASFILLLCLSGCVLEEVSLLYSETAQKDGFEININKTANCCFVGMYSCNEFSDNIEITIPDEYDGMPIKCIGGYYGRGVPTPFFVSLNAHDNLPEGVNGDVYQNDSAVYKDVVVTLNIGKNIKKIEKVIENGYFTHIDEDGSVTIYRPVYKINCSNDNKHFYSKDGKLYNKKTDELIEDFLYVGE